VRPAIIMSRKEVDTLWALFRRIDRSRDGNISVRELNLARKRGDIELTPGEAKALMRFSDLDDNGNKLLTFPAFFIACMDEQLDPRVSPSVLKAFTALDVNNDGYVDKKDLTKAAEVRPAWRIHIGTLQHRTLLGTVPPAVARVPCCIDRTNV
jgi:Ca2+-binding EF-hand superfamily protein